MTMVRPFSDAPSRRGLALGKRLLAIVMMLGTSASLSAQTSSQHWLHASGMPPGAIGAQRLLRGGPLSGFNPLSSYSQPVELTGPKGVTLSSNNGAGYAMSSSGPHSGRLLVGLQVGNVYRFQAVGVPGFPGVQVYPSVELIDRLYPPPGKATEFPVTIELTMDDLRLAAEGAFITKVVYVEDPQTALPIEEKKGQQRFDARGGDDPLVLAGELGRPIAIVRIGSRDYARQQFASPVELAEKGDWLRPGDRTEVSESVAVRCLSPFSADHSIKQVNAIGPSIKGDRH